MATLPRSLIPPPTAERLLRDQSFVITLASQPELHLHQSSTFTRASPSYEVRRGFLQPLLSIFGPDPHSRFAYKPSFFISTATNPSVTTTVSADQLGHILSTSAAATPIDMPLQASTNRPRCHHDRRLLRTIYTICSNYHAVTHVAEDAKHEHRRHLHWPTFKDYYIMTAASTCTLEDTHISPPRTRPLLLRPTILNYYSLVFYRHSAPIASSANTLPSLFYVRSALTQPFETTYRVFSDHRPSTALLPHLPRTLRHYASSAYLVAHSTVGVYLSSLFIFFLHYVCCRVIIRGGVFLFYRCSIPASALPVFSALRMSYLGRSLFEAFVVLAFFSVKPLCTRAPY